MWYKPIVTYFATLSLFYTSIHINSHLLLTIWSCRQACGYIKMVSLSRWSWRITITFITLILIVRTVVIFVKVLVSLFLLLASTVGTEPNIRFPFELDFLGWLFGFTSVSPLVTSSKRNLLASPWIQSKSNPQQPDPQVLSTWLTCT